MGHKFITSVLHCINRVTEYCSVLQQHDVRIGWTNQIDRGPRNDDMRLHRHRLSRHVISAFLALSSPIGRAEIRGIRRFPIGSQIRHRTHQPQLLSHFRDIFRAFAEIPDGLPPDLLQRNRGSLLLLLFLQLLLSSLLSRGLQGRRLLGSIRV